MPQFIVIHNHKGGTGKTTLAVHLAEHIALSGGDVCLYDADPQNNAMMWVTGHKWKGEETIRIPRGDGRGELVATTSPEVAMGHDRVVMDTPPDDEVLERLEEVAQLDEVDVVVCPVNGRLAIDGALKVAEELEGTGCRVVLVANATDPKDDFARDEIAAMKRLASAGEVSVEVFELAIPSNSGIMRQAELRGKMAWEVPGGPRTHTVRALRAVCEALATGVSPASGGEEPPPAVSKLRERLWT